eukprot:NODE_356_length_10223_cov_0.363098.p8 type:complete len:117 gc:universal NODE_356_length_10223_cov_0.363098:8964-9314(+)
MMRLVPLVPSYICALRNLLENTSHEYYKKFYWKCFLTLKGCPPTPIKGLLITYFGNPQISPVIESIASFQSLKDCDLQTSAEDTADSLRVASFSISFGSCVGLVLVSTNKQLNSVV